MVKLAGNPLEAANVARVLDCAPECDYESQAILTESEEAPYSIKTIISDHSSDHFAFCTLVSVNFR